VAFFKSFFNFLFSIRVKTIYAERLFSSNSKLKEKEPACRKKSAFTVEVDKAV
jgi:hypothetical protein